MEIRNKPQGPDNEAPKLGSVMDLRGMAASTPGRAPVPIEAMRIGRCRCGPDGCADSSCPGRATRWYMINAIGMATLCADRDDAERCARDADVAWPRHAPHRAVQLVESSNVDELRSAAQAVVDRWDTPLWKDVPHTGEYINRLRYALDQTAPAKAVNPLTDDQIAKLMMQTWGCASIAPRHAPEFARAIERAHGITVRSTAPSAEEESSA